MKKDNDPRVEIVLALLLWRPVTTDAEGSATVSYTILPKF